MLWRYNATQSDRLQARVMDLNCEWIPVYSEIDIGIFCYFNNRNKNEFPLRWAHLDPMKFLDERFSIELGRKEIASISLNFLKLPWRQRAFVTLFYITKIMFLLKKKNG